VGTLVGGADLPVLLSQWLQVPAKPLPGIREAVCWPGVEGKRQKGRRGAHRGMQATIPRTDVQGTHMVCSAPHYA
jgi:hypothetical protein